MNVPFDRCTGSTGAALSRKELLSIGTSILAEPPAVGRLDQSESAPATYAHLPVLSEYDRQAKIWHLNQVLARPGERSGPERWGIDYIVL